VCQIDIARGSPRYLWLTPCADVQRVAAASARALMLLQVGGQERVQRLGQVIGGAAQLCR
jgi:hypothetical protein